MCDYLLLKSFFRIYFSCLENEWKGIDDGNNRLTNEFERIESLSFDQQMDQYLTGVECP